MNKKNLMPLSFLLAFLLILPFGQAKAAGPSVKRLAGHNRYATSQRVAEELGSNFDKVLVASGESFPDALSASILTEGKYPILLTPGNTLASDVATTIAEADEAIVLGGLGTISEEVFHQIKDLSGDARRIAGKDRYETSSLIAREVFNESIILASGQDFPDALSGGALSIKNNAPIILSPKNGQNNFTVQNAENASNISILGGPGTLDLEFENGLRNLRKNVLRIHGKDRYTTSLDIAKDFGQVDTIIFASGIGFADALSASSLAGKLSAPIILTNGNLTPELQAYLDIQRNNLEKVYIIGGGNTVALNFEKDVEAYLNGTYIDPSYQAGDPKPVERSPEQERIYNIVTKQIREENLEFDLEGMSYLENHSDLPGAVFAALDGSYYEGILDEIHYLHDSQDPGLYQIRLILRHEVEYEPVIHSQAAEAARRLTKEVLDNGGSRRDILKAFNDYLALKTTYDQGEIGPSGREEINNIQVYSPASIVYNEKGVCQAYATFFQAMCDSVGIPCRYMNGNALYPDGTLIPHAWNEVYVDGEWLGLDVTWSDLDQGDELSYQYFLKDLSSTHFPENKLVGGGQY